MGVDRRARAVWSGTLREGEGTLTAESSGLFTDAPVTWVSRTEDPSGGRTSPEELLAAAHASCFAMSLSAALQKAGTPPEQLDVTATCTIDRVEQGFGITVMHLEVRGRVPGADAEGFSAAAKGAKENCPVSRALAGIPEIVLDATLEPAA
jgi:osmotically inducible protein OsmC